MIAQVVLAFQLPFTLIPLIKASSDRKLMGPFANSLVIQIFAWLSILLIFIGNIMVFATLVPLPEHLGASQSRISIHDKRLVGNDSLLSEVQYLTDISWTKLILAGAVVLAVLGAVVLLIWMLLAPVSVPEKLVNQTLNVLIPIHDHIDRDRIPLIEHHRLEEIILKDDQPVQCQLVLHPEHGLGRGARKSFASTLELFWEGFYDLMGNPVESGSPVCTSLADCLLSIHKLDNASSVLPFADAPPWQSVNATVVSLMHLAMEDKRLDSSNVVFPWTCPQCRAEISDPFAVSVSASRALPKDQNILFVFGLWNLRQLLHLCYLEPRPELWGKYASVLNRLQWLLPLIPCTVNASQITREDILRLLHALEQRLSERRGQKGTAPAATAYPKVRNRIFRRRDRVSLGKGNFNPHHQTVSQDAAAERQWGWSCRRDWLDRFVTLF